jgi:hypothetical protein
MAPLDGFGPSRTEIEVQTDAVIAAFGLPVSRAGLADMAAEMERRVHIFAGGPVAAMQVVAELRRRALAAPAQGFSRSRRAYPAASCR